MSGEKQHLVEKETSDSHQTSWAEYTAGLAILCLYAFLSSASSICVQALERRIPDFELNGARFLCGFFLGLCVCTVRKINPLVKSRTDLFPIGIGSLFNIMTVTGRYIAVSLSPLVTIEILIQSTKLIIGWLIFWIFLKHKPRVVETFSIILILIGIVLVLQPDFLFANRIQGKCDGYENFTSHCANGSSIERNPVGFHMLLGCLLATLSGICSVGKITNVKKFSDFFHSQSNRWRTVFWTCFSGAAASFVVMGFAEKPVFPETMTDLALLFGHVGTYMFMPGLYFYGCTIIDGNIITIILSSVIIYMVVAQYTFMSHTFPGHRNWIEVFGALLVFASCVLAPTVTSISKKKETDQTEKKDSEEEGAKEIPMREMPHP